MASFEVVTSVGKVDVREKAEKQREESKREYLKNRKKAE
jgi:hypothetical protein